MVDALRPSILDKFVPRKPKPDMTRSFVPAPEEEPVQDTSLPPGQRFMEEILKLRTQRGPAMSAYEEHLKATPSAEDHKPGWFTRIAAGLSGLSAGMRNPMEGVTTARAINRGGYDAALEDYYNRAGVLGSAAEIERKDREDYIDALKAGAESGLTWEKFLEDKRKNEQAGRVAQQNADTAQARAEAYIESVANPGFDHFVQEDGSILRVHKRTGERSIIPAKDVRAFSARTNAQIGFGNLNARNRQIDQDQAQHEDNLEFKYQDMEGRRYDAKKSRELRERISQAQREFRSSGGANNVLNQQRARNLAMEQAFAEGLEGVEQTPGGYYQIIPDKLTADTKSWIDARVAEILRGR